VLWSMHSRCNATLLASFYRIGTSDDVYVCTIAWGSVPHAGFLLAGTPLKSTLLS
jgi:hypothetical protein